MARERDAVLVKLEADGGPTPRPSPQQAKLSAFLEDLESMSFHELGDAEGGAVVYLQDAAVLLRQFAEEADETGVTGVWPHTPSRRAPANVRLHMPMDLPVFGELKRPVKQADPSRPKGYIFNLDCFAWGREVVVRLVGDDIAVYVKDALATRKVYVGKRKDEGDPYRHVKGR